MPSYVPSNERIRDWNNNRTRQEWINADVYVKLKIQSVEYRTDPTKRGRRNDYFTQRDLGQQVKVLNVWSQGMPTDPNDMGSGRGRFFEPVGHAVVGGGHPPQILISTPRNYPNLPSEIWVVMSIGNPIFEIISSHGQMDNIAPIGMPGLTKANIDNMRARPDVSTDKHGNMVDAQGNNYGPRLDALTDDELDSIFQDEFGDNYVDTALTNFEMYTAEMDAMRATMERGYTAQSFKSIIGIPFQFKAATDPRIHKAAYGRMYNENFLMDSPVATINVGGPRFLYGKGVSSGDRTAVGRIMDSIGNAADNLGDRLEDVLAGKNAKFYTFMGQPAVYQKYVNTMARDFARYCSLEGNENRFRGTGRTLDMTMVYHASNIETDGGDSVRSLYGSLVGVNIYHKPETLGSESLSNSAGQPQIASIINGTSAKVREAEVLFGTGGGMALGGSSINAEDNITEMASVMDNNPSNVLTRLFSSGRHSMKIVSSGANMDIPDIWQDSSSGRSHEVKTVLSSPYGSTLSLFWNVLRPLSNVVPIGFARQFGPNGYTTPFIVQAFSKGCFNCEMGIVSDISIVRSGGGELQSFHNIPMEIEVTLTIKDMYPALSMSRDDLLDMHMNNIGFLDFMASFSGVSLNQPEPMRKLKRMLTSTVTRLTDIPATVKLNIYGATRDMMRRVFN